MIYLGKQCHIFFWNVTFLFFSLFFFIKIFNFVENSVLRFRHIIQAPFYRMRALHLLHLKNFLKNIFF